MRSATGPCWTLVTQVIGADEATLYSRDLLRLTSLRDLLSGGQRQRVALAWALAQDAPVLVLHDPTTAVDSVTETFVAERVRQSRDGRTTIVIGDSPAFRAAADRVIDLDDAEAIA